MSAAALVSGRIRSIILQLVAHDALIGRHERPWTPRFFLDASSSLLLEAKLAVGRARLAAAARFLCNSVPTPHIPVPQVERRARRQAAALQVTSFDR